MTTRTTNRIARAGAPARCRLCVVFGPDAGLTVEIPPAGVVVGASASCDVVLADRAVSSRHCAIRPSEAGFKVADLGSRNGVFFDGAAIADASVPAGAALRLGGSIVQLLPADEVVVVKPSERESFGGMVGGSLAMRRIFALLEMAAGSSVPVLLTGETGTGKEVCARAVHENSPRREGPLVVFDCAAASETLIESDLFGHVRGAFTGAERERPGAFASAHGGTLFLDEIGELPPRLQPKLLRILETGEAQPLGGRGSARYDVRVVAATHRDLHQEVARGTFRGDLYYRLAVVEICLPALRERIEDIPALVQVFLRAGGAPSQDLASPNVERLTRYAWPGNVRELRNVVSRAVALSPPGTPFSQMPILLGAGVRGASPLSTLGAPPAPQTPPAPPPSPQESAGAPSVRADRPFVEAKAALVDKFEREYLKDLLARHGDNLSEAARVAGIERKHLYRIMARLGLTSGGD